MALRELLREPRIDLKYLARKLTYQLRRNEEARIARWLSRGHLPPRRWLARA